MASKLEEIEPRTIRLNADQKIRIRDQQVKVLALANQAHALRQQSAEVMEKAQAGDRELQQLLNAIAGECHADLAKYNFDIEAAQFVWRK